MLKVTMEILHQGDFQRYYLHELERLRQLRDSCSVGGRGGRIRSLTRFHLGRRVIFVG